MLCELRNASRRDGDKKMEMMMIINVKCLNCCLSEKVAIVLWLVDSSLMFLACQLFEGEC